MIAAQGPSDSLAFYWAASVTAAWNPEIVAGAWHQETVDTAANL